MSYKDFIGEYDITKKGNITELTSGCCQFRVTEKGSKSDILASLIGFKTLREFNVENKDVNEHLKSLHIRFTGRKIGKQDI